MCLKLQIFSTSLSGIRILCGGSYTRFPVWVFPGAVLYQKPNKRPTNRQLSAAVMRNLAHLETIVVETQLNKLKL